MHLHDNNEIFAELIAATAETIGLPQVYVEKDYWVTKALLHLSQSNHAKDVVFKGGTSLSKAYRLIERFSEDIDLAVFSGQRGDTVRKKQLKSVESVVATGLTRLDGDARESKGSKFRKTVYEYPRQATGENFGQASPELLVEINAFTRPEPNESRELQTLIAEMLAGSGRDDLIEEFSLQSFSVNVLSLRRTLVEKMLGVIKDSYDTNPVARLSGRIRHLYDICLMMQQDDIKEFIASPELKTLCDLCIEDEKAGFFKYSDSLEKPLGDAPLFLQFESWQPALRPTYNGVFSELVYGDMPSLEEVAKALVDLRECLPT